MRKSVIAIASVAIAFTLTSCSNHTTTPPPSNCFNINWTELDTDGMPFIPVDVNNDGFIDCNSDLELGA
jgi:hypothetical protein